MFRFLMLRNKLGLQRSLVTRLTARSNVSDLGSRFAHHSRIIDGVVVVDINLEDISKGDAEFARSFAKSMSALDRSQLKSVGGPVGNSPQPEVTVPADGSQPPSAPSSVLDINGKPIVHVDIDGWNQDDTDGEIAEEQKKQDVNIADPVDKK